MQPSKQVYSYGIGNNYQTLEDYIKSIQVKYPKPDPIEEEINVNDYETNVKNAVKEAIMLGKDEMDITIDLMPELFDTVRKEHQPSRSFSHTDFNDITERTWRNIKNLTELKGGEYAGDVDRLANFRLISEQLGIPMETVWSVYASKHWAAVMQYTKDLKENKARDRMEPIEGRCDDLIVYLMLFKAMIKERSK